MNRAATYLYTQLEPLAFDMRYAVRSLLAGKVITLWAFVVLTATTTLGTVAFSVVDGVALRPLPYGSPKTLVSLSAPSPTPGHFYPPSPQDFLAWLDGTQAFEALAAARTIAPVPIDIDGRTEWVPATSVTPNLFEVLKVHPHLGSFFGPEHAHAASPPAVILSHDLWVRAFNADPDVAGRTVPVGKQSRQVLGVLPQGVWYPISAGAQPGIYVPYVLPADQRFQGAPRRGFISVVGRLRADVTVQQAHADANRVSPAVVVALEDYAVGREKKLLVLALVGVCLVLLVAFTNVANLLLARTVMRAQEFAIRQAVGGSHTRVIRGLFLEGVLLASASAAGALLMAHWSMEFAKSSLPANLSRVGMISIDGRVLGACMIAALVCATMTASAPAWLVSRNRLGAAMSALGPAVLNSQKEKRTLAAFVAADIAFVCFLLVPTALVIGTYVYISTMDLGFDRRNVITMSYRRSLKEVPSGDRRIAAAVLREELLSSARSIPGVLGAAIAVSDSPPLSGSSVRYDVVIPGSGETQRVETNMVTSDYFTVMGMEVITGRGFGAEDRWGAPRVIIINDAAARQWFPGRDAVGQVVNFSGDARVIGVLRGVYFDGPEGNVRPAIYTHVHQEARSNESTSGSLVIKASRNPKNIARTVQEAIRPILNGDPGPPRLMDQYFDRLTAGRRFNAAIMATFGIVAVMIAAIGVFGTTSFAVGRQRRAIGLHMALGASRTTVIRTVLQRVLGIVVFGIVIGLAGAFASSRALESIVFGIRPTDWRIYGFVGSFVVAVAFAAALWPAMRAAALNPLVALRHE